MQDLENEMTEKAAQAEEKKAQPEAAPARGAAEKAPEAASCDCGAKEEQKGGEPPCEEVSPEELSSRLAAAEQKVAELTAKLEASEKKVASNYDLYVRAKAELENARKRADADVLKAHKFGNEKFATNLLPVVDSLEKALDHAKDMDGPLKDGLEAINRQLLHAMEVSGMKPFDPKGEKFDPNLQQAVTVVPKSEGLEPGMVAAVFQKGWMIQERVLRPAMVAVVQG